MINFLKKRNLLFAKFISLILGIGLLTLTASAEIELPMPLDELTIAEAQQAFVEKKLSIKGLTLAYLARIHAQNKKGPNLRAVIIINPDALASAAKLDQILAKEYSYNLSKLPLLFGVPILLKDNIETQDQMPTTAGSLALKDNFTKEDATFVANLRQQGAIILGKTNLSEWANFRSDSASSGWSALGGQTKNPYVLSYSPCGSSAGTAVAIAANWALLGVGTETDGSIVCPASINGLVGIKPTLGLVSRTGVIPLAHSQDTAGPMARTVKDATILLQAMVSKDSLDKATKQQPNSPKEYSEHLKSNGLQGKTIGVISGLFDLDRRSKRLYREALATLTSQGAELILGLQLEVSEEMSNAELEVLLYEFKHNINKYLKERSKKNTLTLPNLKALIGFNNYTATLSMPFFGQELFHAAQEKGDLSDDAYQQALKNNGPAMRQLIDQLMDKHNLDLLVMPTTNPSWSIDLVNGDRYTGGSSSFAAVSGYPSITVPMGLVHELPVGISFVAQKYREDILIEAAFAYEQASMKRKPPKFIPTLVD